MPARPQWVVCMPTPWRHLCRLVSVSFTVLSRAQRLARSDAEDFAEIGRTSTGLVIRRDLGRIPDKYSRAHLWCISGVYLERASGISPVYLVMPQLQRAGRGRESEPHPSPRACVPATRRVRRRNPGVSRADLGRTSGPRFPPRAPQMLHPAGCPVVASFTSRACNRYAYPVTTAAVSHGPVQIERPGGANVEASLMGYPATCIRLASASASALGGIIAEIAEIAPCHNLIALNEAVYMFLRDPEARCARDHPRCTRDAPQMHPRCMLWPPPRRRRVRLSAV